MRRDFFGALPYGLVNLNTPSPADRSLMIIPMSYDTIVTGLPARACTLTARSNDLVVRAREPVMPGGIE